MPKPGPEIPVRNKSIQTNVVQTKVPADIRKRFDALSDISGLTAPEILRHCIHRAFPDVEAMIMAGDIPPEPYFIKELRTKPHRLADIPIRSEIGVPPSLISIIQTGVFPADYEAEEIPEWERREESVAAPPPSIEPASEPAPRVRRRRRG